MKPILLGLFLSFAFAAPALAQAPAARVTDPTSHGGSIAGPGVPSVIIAGRVAAVLGDQTTCPLFDGVAPHVGGPIVTASNTVLIGGKRAARMGDLNAESGPSATISSGAATVIIGP